MRRERRNGVIMSESYAVNEKRELILQKVKEFIVAHGGIVKKNQLEELHIDYRRILDFVEKGLLFTGASENTLEYAVDYLSIYLLGTVFVEISTGLNSFINAQGRPAIAMYSVLIG